MTTLKFSPFASWRRFGRKENLMNCTKLFLPVLVMVLALAVSTSCRAFNSIGVGLPMASGPHLDVGYGWDQDVDGAELPWMSALGTYTFSLEWGIRDVVYHERSVVGHIVTAASREIEFFYRGKGRLSVRKYVMTFPLKSKAGYKGMINYVFDDEAVPGGDFGHDIFMVKKGIKKNGCHVKIVVSEECKLIALLGTHGRGTYTIFISFL